MVEKSVVKKPGKLNKEKQTADTTRERAASNHKQATQFQKIFDALPVAMVFVDGRGQIQYMNAKAKSMLGETNDLPRLEEWPEKFGFYLDDAILHYPGEKFPLVRAIQGETVDESEEMILRKEGHEQGIWISMSTELLKDENGNIEGAIALIRDINYRKQIELSREKQVRRAEMLYKFSHAIAEEGTELDKILQLVVKFTSDLIGDLSIITLLNNDGDKLKTSAFHHPNPSAQALLRKFMVPGFEYEHAQTLGGSVIRSSEPLLLPFISPEQVKALTLSDLGEYIHEFGIESILMVPLVGRSGTLGMISLSRNRGSKPFNMEDQSFLTDVAYRVVLAIENCRLFDSLRTEISERLSAKRDLEISQERFRSIFESVTLGIKVLDLEGNILQTNSAFQEMLGYKEDELTGKPFHNFLYSDDVARGLKLFLDIKNKGVSSFRFEHRTVHKDESIVWARTFFTVVKKDGGDDGPAFIAGIVENITEQKRLELEMAELKDRLQNSMELERLRLAQELHDNPMQVLYSASYRLEELRTKVDPELSESLKGVKDIIQTVLQDLRATAKELRPPTIFSFGLENAIRSHAYDVQEKHPDIQIHLSLAHDSQSLPDHVRLALFRVLQQALGNVIRHAEATEVHIRFSFDAEEAHLEISDNGKGFEVPANWIDFVRQEHFGLAGAAERVSALGGVLNVESRSGKSTAVKVTIPWNDTD
jgi:PAS domain S-box-containing protein